MTCRVDVSIYFFFIKMATGFRRPWIPRLRFWGSCHHHHHHHHHHHQQTSPTSFLQKGKDAIARPKYKEYTERDSILYSCIGQWVMTCRDMQSRLTKCYLTRSSDIKLCCLNQNKQFQNVKSQERFPQWYIRIRTYIYNFIFILSSSVLCLK